MTEGASCKVAHEALKLLLAVDGADVAAQHAVQQQADGVRDRAQHRAAIRAHRAFIHCQQGMLGCHPWVSLLASEQQNNNDAGP